MGWWLQTFFWRLFKVQPKINHSFYHQWHQSDVKDSHYQFTEVQINPVSQSEFCFRCLPIFFDRLTFWNPNTKFECQIDIWKMLPLLLKRLTLMQIKLSTSIYDLVLIYVCHFHHHYHHLTVTQIIHLIQWSLFKFDHYRDTRASILDPCI